jgi:hypothetical protein
MPTWAYGLIALVIFIVLAAVAWSFRDVSNRHIAKAEAYAKAHGAPHGSAAGGAGSDVAHGH